MNASSTIATRNVSLFAAAAALALGACASPSGDAIGESGAEAALTVGAPAMPAGNYRGTGDFVAPDSSESGPYRSEYRISADAVDLRYAWGPKDAPVEEHVTLHLTWTSPHEFTFTTDGAEKNDVGTGYCTSDRCQFSAASGGVVWFEMTLAFGTGTLTGVGSKRMGDRYAYWNESLRKI
jgi:hypothetical protein